MAKLPALIDAFQKIDGRDRATIEHYARVVREAGYITTTKRGSGAAEMTPSDAVNLWLALALADTPKAAPLAIDRARSLVQGAEIGRGKTPAHVTDQEFYGTLPVAIQAVAEARTLGAALEGLIENGIDLLASFTRYAIESFEGHGTETIVKAMFNSGMIAGLEINFCKMHVSIQLFRETNSREIDFETKFLVDDDRFMEGFYGHTYDRRPSVTYGLPTVASLVRTLCSNSKLSEIAGNPAGERTP